MHLDCFHLESCPLLLDGVLLLIFYTFASDKLYVLPDQNEEMSTVTIQHSVLLRFSKYFFHWSALILIMNAAAGKAAISVYFMSSQTQTYLQE